jgi:polyisoprenoid-binding protein YceI
MLLYSGVTTRIDFSERSSMRLKALAAAALFLVSSVAFAEPYKFDPTHTQIRFDWIHTAGVTLSGFFTKYDGSIDLNFKDPVKSSVNVTLDVSGLWTGVPKFDEHLKNADFFESAKYPTITFKSMKAVKTSATTGKLTGDLTVKGVTKPITFDVVATSKFEKVERLGFMATAKVKRSDLGLGLYAPAVPEEVTIVIATEVLAPKSEKN